jgi:hypothetical protein
MMKNTIAAFALMCCVAPAGAAQLYRWVDAQGRVEWRDTPPPADAKTSESRKVQGNVAPSTQQPYALQRASTNFPVTLWTTACGEACDKAKSHLARRGVPYAEKDAKADLDALRKSTGGLDVPVLVVGRIQLKGYSETGWDQALDSAGYPGPSTIAP